MNLIFRWHLALARMGGFFRILIVALVLLAACGTPSSKVNTPAQLPTGVIPVRVSTTANGYQLLREGQPYYIKGGAGLQHFDEVKRAGGNSIRLYSTDYAEPLLAAAQQQGLTVTLGLWLPRVGDGFDYHDKAAVDSLVADLRQQVLRYRNAPALLLWGIGNEVTIGTADPKIFQAINAIANMIHELDPYHPVITTLDGTGMVYAVRKMSPAIDILAINAFARLDRLPHDISLTKWTKPYLVTEYGPRGYWESDSTVWGARLEQTSKQKADFIRERYQKTIAGNQQCLGSYVFYWGQKNEMTPTWFSLFSETGEKTEAVDLMYELWSQRLPANQAPHLLGFTLANTPLGNPNLRLQTNKVYPARVLAQDPEGDSLNTRWKILSEGRRRFNTPSSDNSPPEPVAGSEQEVRGLTAPIRTPRTPGYYRLYVTVTDGQGNIATANQPFRCY